MVKTAAGGRAARPPAVVIFSQPLTPRLLASTTRKAASGYRASSHVLVGHSPLLGGVSLNCPAPLVSICYDSYRQFGSGARTGLQREIHNLSTARTLEVPPLSTQTMSHRDGARHLASPELRILRRLVG